MFWVTRGGTPRQVHEVLAYGLSAPEKGRCLTTCSGFSAVAVGTGHALEDAPGTIDV